MGATFLEHPSQDAQIWNSLTVFQSHFGKLVEVDGDHTSGFAVVNQRLAAERFQVVVHLPEFVQLLRVGSDGRLTFSCHGKDVLACLADHAIGQGEYGRRVFVMAASAGITALQTWDQYLTEQRQITTGLAAPRVLVVPQLHGNDLGVLAGRLADAAASIADTPMRVATGPVLGLGPVPVDKAGVLLPSAIRAELDKARFSVSQTYPDYEGVYWGDGNMLDTPASDFLVVEYLRLADKAARQVRPLLIRRVGDRRLNNTPNSMAAAVSAFMKPLRLMAKSVTFAGLVFPGEIESPKDGDIVLVWLSKTKVEIYIKIRPLNCPKDLTANIALDLSTDD